jgi:succinate dehydrogenase/fumarate reductase flavoprotein subunit
VADLEVDLVVLGFGAAGAAAALTAARAGLSVLVVEKQESGAHVSSARMSGGLVMAVGDIEEGTRYLEHCAAAMTPTEVTAAWAQRAALLPGWLHGIGIETRRVAGAWHPKFAGCDAIDVLAPLRPGAAGRSLGADELERGAQAGMLPSLSRFAGGVEVMDALELAVNDADGVTVRYGCRVQRLLVEPGSGRVSGAVVTGAAGSTAVHGRLGVVLATGGFEFDEQMKLNYLRAYPIHFYGSPANTGDGVRLAQQVGADFWHMNQMVGRAVTHFTAGDGTPRNFNVDLAPPGYVIVDKLGRRYANEYNQAVSKPHFYFELLAYDGELMDYPRIPSYWVFDSRRMGAGPLVSNAAGLTRTGGYSWSVDNSAEVAAGWITTGATLEEALAAAGASEPSVAVRTIELYNESCTNGVDPLGRPAESLIPIDQPPYFCVPLYPGGANTCGGPRRDERARILDPNGEPIPGLFGAGELGQVVGLLYPSGGANLSDAFCFGQIAVETALESAGLR